MKHCYTPLKPKYRPTLPISSVTDWHEKINPKITALPKINVLQNYFWNGKKDFLDFLLQNYVTIFFRRLVFSSVKLQWTVSVLSLWSVSVFIYTSVRSISMTNFLLYTFIIGITYLLHIIGWNTLCFNALSITDGFLNTNFYLNTSDP